MGVNSNLRLLTVALAFLRAFAAPESIRVMLTVQLTDAPDGNYQKAEFLAAFNAAYPAAVSAAGCTALGPLVDTSITYSSSTASIAFNFPILPRSINGTALVVADPGVWFSSLDPASSQMKVLANYMQVAMAFTSSTSVPLLDMPAAPGGCPSGQHDFLPPSPPRQPPSPLPPTPKAAAQRRPALLAQIVMCTFAFVVALLATF